ncbi:MAG: SDR family oxidoreductase [Candidatus Cloacimonetes bacterium]|nr:SDR family oxidoreductase [Candidatus Cloacimonadota bacterium]
MKIFIAGASGGIGSYLAEMLSTQHQVYGSYNSRPPSVATKHFMAKVDISSQDEVTSWISSNSREDDDLALIFCVGINYNSMIHKSKSEKWQKVIETNLYGVQAILKEILPLMRKRRFGRIILFSSVVPQKGVLGTSAYAASKSALWGLSKAVAKENATHGITINTINLGYFDIGMIQDVPSEMLNKIIEEIPMQRLGDPINILYTVEYLLAADYITGSCIDVSGGLV